MTSQPLKGETMAKCPWCKEEIALAEVYEVLPPLLIIDDPIPDPEAESSNRATDETGLPANEGSESANDSAEWANDSSEWMEQQQDDPSSFSQEGQDVVGTEGARDVFEFEEEILVEQDPIPHESAPLLSMDEASQLEGLSSDPDSTSVRVSPRPARRTGFFSNWFVQSVIGLLIAMPAAGGVLWMVGSPPDLGFWPFEPSRPSRRAAPLPPMPVSQADPEGSDGVTEFMQPDELPEISEDVSSSIVAKKPPTSSVAMRQEDAAKQPEMTEDVVPENVQEDPASNPTATPSESNVTVDTPSPVDDGDTTPAIAKQAISELDSLDQVSRDAEGYWVDVVNVYSKVSALAASAEPGAPHLEQVLDKLEMSNRLQDLSTRTTLWLSLSSQDRMKNPLLNDGVIVMGRFTDGATPTLRMNDGNAVQVRGQIPRGAQDQPLLGLGRIIKPLGEEPAEVEIVASRAR